MMPFSKKRRSSDYLQDILTDGAKPFLYRTNLRVLLGMKASTGFNRILPATSPPVEFVYLARRIQNRFKIDRSSLAGKTTVPASYSHKSQQNIREEMTFRSLTKKADFVESAEKGFFNDKQGKIFPDRIRSQKEPISTQQMTSLTQDEGVPETDPLEDNDRVEASVNSQTEKQQSSTLRTIAIPGMTTSPFSPSLLHAFGNHKAMQDQKPVSAPKTILPIAMKDRGDLPDKGEHQPVSALKAKLPVAVKGREALTHHRNLQRTDNVEFHQEGPGKTSFIRMNPERNSSGIVMTSAENVRQPQQDFTVIERMEQIRHTTRELALKNVFHKSTDGQEINENEPKPRPHAALPVRKIFIVQRQGKKIPVTSVFWQRNCLGRFHLRPLR
jgi:hypothetical protein